MEEALRCVMYFTAVGLGLGMMFSAAGYALNILLSIINRVVTKGVK